MPTLPYVHYSTLDLPEEQAFAEWREIISPQYRVARAVGAASAPRGAISYHLLGEIIANRTVFGPQSVSRDARLVSNTPDHLVLQFWRTGGYRGEVGGEPIVLGPGHAVLANRRRELAARFTASDTVGLVVPRASLAGIDVDQFGTRLDPARDRLAAARIAALFRTLPHTEAGDAAAVRDELVGFLRRLLDPSRAADVLEGPELDAGVAELARRAIDDELGSPSLTPDRVAERVGVSRATLYRAFTAEGGLMRAIWSRRLAAVAAALADPIEMRRLSRLAADTGFKSPAHLSRAFAAAYGMPPREWRRARATGTEAGRLRSPESIHRWWNEIGA